MVCCRYDPESALKFYEKAVQLEPNDVNLLDAAGELCVEVKGRKRGSGRWG